MAQVLAQISVSRQVIAQVTYHVFYDLCNINI